MSINMVIGITVGTALNKIIYGFLPEDFGTTWMRLIALCLQSLALLIIYGRAKAEWEASRKPKDTESFIDDLEEPIWADQDNKLSKSQKISKTNFGNNSTS